MKILIPIALTISFLAVYSEAASQNASQSSVSQLKVIVEDSIDLFENNIFAMSDGAAIKFNLVRDNNPKGYAFVCNDLQNGRYEINLSALYQAQFKKTIVLTNDTTIVLNKGSLTKYESARLNYFFSDLGSDTLNIGYKGIGCFYNEECMLRIYKEAENYIAEFITDTSSIPGKIILASIKKTVPASSFVWSLDQFETKCLMASWATRNFTTSSQIEIGTNWIIRLQRGNKSISIRNNRSKDDNPFPVFLASLKFPVQ